MNDKFKKIKKMIEIANSYIYHKIFFNDSFILNVNLHIL